MATLLNREQAAARVVAATVVYTKATLAVLRPGRWPSPEACRRQVKAYSDLSAAQWELERVLRREPS